jgi:hypothetical protein
VGYDRSPYRRAQFAAVYLAVKGIINVKDAINAEGTGGFDVGDVFKNASAYRRAPPCRVTDMHTVFRNIVLSLLATYGLYLIASILFFEVRAVRPSCVVEIPTHCTAVAHVRPRDGTGAQADTLGRFTSFIQYMLVCCLQGVAERTAHLRAQMSPSYINVIVRAI